MKTLKDVVESWRDMNMDGLVVSAESVRLAIEMIEMMNKVIGKYFEDVPISLYEMQYMLGCSWFLADDDIHFAYEGEETNEADDFTCVYSVVRNSLYTRGDFTVAHVHDGCGNNFSVILDNNKRHKEFE